MTTHVAHNDFNRPDIAIEAWSNNRTKWEDIPPEAPVCKATIPSLIDAGYEVTIKHEDGTTITYRKKETKS